MEVVAAIFLNVVFWSTIAYLFVETVRGGRTNIPRRRYLVYGLLWFGGPFLAAPTGAVVAGHLFDDTRPAVAVGIAVPLVVCWGAAITLLLRWRRTDHE